MQNIIYRFRKNSRQKTYGIEIVEEGEPVQYIPDVFKKRRHIKKLVHICNKHDVSPMHIHDVIEDMKYEMNMA